jgi:UDP-sugar transporter A1/2/3
LSQYVGLSNLDASLFQVVNSLKLLATAVFASLLLGQRYSTAKWLALSVLALGVSLAQREPPHSSTLSIVDPASATVTRHDNPLLGFSAVCLSCVTSGLAGCWFERVLKAPQKPSSSSVEKSGSPNTTTTITKIPTLWQRNLQLSVPSFIFALGAVFLDPSVRSVVISEGFFKGYDAGTCGVVAFQALGGLLVALVVREAGSVVKGFATSLAIVGKSNFLHSLPLEGKKKLDV